MIISSQEELDAIIQGRKSANRDRKKAGLPPIPQIDGFVYIPQPQKLRKKTQKQKNCNLAPVDKLYGELV